MKLFFKPIAKPFILASLSSLMLVEFVRNALIISLLPNLGVDVPGLTPAVVGLAISVHYFFDNILRTPMGMLVDRYGHRLALSIGLVFAAIGLLLIASADTPLTMILGGGLFGIGASPLWPTVISAITSTCKEEEKASAMGYVYTAWLIGGGAGPVLINFIFVWSLRATFTILVSLLLIAGLLALTVRVKHHSHGTIRETFSQIDLRRYFREIIVHLKEIRILFPGMFVQTFAIGVLIPILTPYARVVLGISPQLQSLAIILVGGATVILLPVMGRLVDRLGARPFLSGGFLLSSAMLILFSLQRSIIPAILFMIMLGVSYSMILPSWNSVLDRSIAHDKRGAMWGVFMTIEGLGTATGPLFGGRLWDSFSPQAPFWLSAIVVGTMGILYLFLRLPGLQRYLRPTTKAS